MEVPHLDYNLSFSQGSSVASQSQLNRFDSFGHLQGLRLQLYESIQLFQSREEKNCLKKLNQILLKIKAKDPQNEFQYWELQCLTLYYMSMCLSQLNEKVKCAKINRKLQNKIQSLINLKSKDLQTAIPPHYFRIKSIYVNLLLFSCSILSEIGNHEQAYQKAIKAYEAIIHLFKTIYIQYPHEVISVKCNTNNHIYFSQIILHQSLPIIQEIVDYPNIENSWENSHLLEIKGTISSWKLNPEHNIFELARKLGVREQSIIQSEKRNILGIKDFKQNPPSQPMDSIFEEIIKLQKISLYDFSRSDDLVYEVSEKNLKTKLEYLAVSIFFLATEHNQIEFVRTTFLPFPVSPKNSIKKTQYFYLKAIQTVIRYLKSNKSLLKQIIIDYHKNFEQCFLKPISQENTVIQSSRLTSPAILSKQNKDPVLKQFEQKVQNLYYIKTQKSVKKSERRKKSPMKKFKIKEKEKKKKNEGDVSPFTYSSNNKSLWKRSQSTVDVPSQNNISMEHNPKIKQVLNHSLSSKGRRSRKTK